MPGKSRSKLIVGSMLATLMLITATGASIFAEEANDLLTAATDGDYEHVQRLIESGAAIEAIDEEGNTLLHIASDRGYDKLAKLFVKKGLDVNAKNSEGLTPLHEAASMGDFETTSLLIEHGADIKATCNIGATPLHYAAEMRNFEMAQINRALGIASSYNWKEDNLKVAELLIDNGADVNAQDKFGRTPLQRTTPWNNLPVARLLVENGANIELQDEDGLTPLQHAKAKGARDITKYLKKVKKKS